MNEKNIPDKGTYCLIINVQKSTNIKIGAKGKIFFEKGFYVYVGSALSTLSKRIERHFSSHKKKHWHVDYLLLNKNTNLEQVIYTYSTKKIECEISNQINEKTDKNIESFGCSDCKCISHLYYFDELSYALKISNDAYEKIGYKPNEWL